MTTQFATMTRSRARPILNLEDQPSQLDEHGPVFIQGCPRSGTTFLTNALARLDSVEEVTGILVPPRTMHLLGLMSREGANTRALTKCVRDVFWQVFWRRRYSISDRFISMIRGRMSVAQCLARPSLANLRFVYKEPFICFGIESLIAEFPNCRVIHIVRDGRDAADSLDRKYPEALSDGVLRNPALADDKNSEIGSWREYDGWCIPWWVPHGQESAFVSASKFGRSLWLWREMTAQGQAARQLLGPERYLEIRYEQLVEAPLEHGRQLADFLGCGMNKRYRRFLKGAHTRSVHIYQRPNNHFNAEEAESIAGETLRRLGYL